MSLALKALKKSPWVFHVNTGACNNCDIEILDCLTPRFDVERFGVVLVGSIRHADVLLISGPVTNIVGPMDKYIPVDAYIPGCPPKPETIISGIVKVLNTL
jgi:Ni,Fe-hydrogenase III small subunit